jgi:hypothetical protein
MVRESLRVIRAIESRNAWKRADVTALDFKSEISDLKF